MVRGNRESWNIRDHHMADTIDRLARHYGLGSKGLIWKHSTHTGAHGLTDMAREGSTRSADSSGSDTAAMASR